MSEETLLDKNAEIHNEAIADLAKHLEKNRKPGVRSNSLSYVPPKLTVSSIA